MGVISEFKAFAVKGNVVDMAVGIIIGAAFGKIVSSFVGDVVMPPIGLLIGGRLGATASSRFRRLMAFTPMKIANATITKSITLWMNLPYANTTAGTSPCAALSVIAKSPKSTPPINRPMGGTLQTICDLMCR